MKINTVVLTTALLGGLLSSSSFAGVVLPVDSAPAEIQAPVPDRVIRPTGLFRRHEGATVTLSMTIDAAGKPHDIKLASGQDRNLVERLLPAVAKWKFTPAMKDGKPVPVKVLLPVQLVDVL